MVSISSLFSSIIEFLGNYIAEIIILAGIFGVCVFLMRVIAGPEEMKNYQR